MLPSCAETGSEKPPRASHEGWVAGARRPWVGYFFFFFEFASGGLGAAGFIAYGLPPSMFETSAIAFCALTLLPAASSGGEITATPNLPGETARMPPPTPLLAGRPVA